MRSSCIFHTIGISAAADKYAEVWHDTKDQYANHRQCAERIIAAYLSASSPNEKLEDRMKALEDKVSSLTRRLAQDSIARDLKSYQGKP